MFLAERRGAAGLARAGGTRSSSRGPGGRSASCSRRVNALTAPPPARSLFAAVGWAALAGGLILANLGHLELRARDLVPLALVAFGARLLYRARTEPKGVR